MLDVPALNAMLAIITSLVTTLVGLLMTIEVALPASVVVAVPRNDLSLFRDRLFSAGIGRIEVRNSVIATAEPPLPLCELVVKV